MAPPPIANDDGPLNDSGVVARSIDIPFLKDSQTGKVFHIRAVIAGYTAALAEEAEQRMRDGVKRMAEEAVARGAQHTLP